MGLFDKIKTTAQSAVNSVTGNQPATQQPTQPEQPVQQAPQEAQPQVNQENTIPAQPQTDVPVQAPEAAGPRNSDPNTFLGKEYRGAGPGAAKLFTSTWFYEDYLQYGNDKIPYSDLSDITITHYAAKMVNGTATTYWKSAGRPLSLSFNNFVLGFEKGVEYANSKIAEINGTAGVIKFSIHNKLDEKLVVYEDYLSVSKMGKALATVMGNDMNVEIIMFASISNIAATPDSILAINYTDEDGNSIQSNFSFKPDDSNIVNEIISYVQNYTPDTSDNIDEETWKFVTGSVREFPLLGVTLTVNENWDVYNSYRTLYMECAAKYAKQLRNKYIQRVSNFDSFMRFYPSLYKEYLDKLIAKTTDILVSAGIWTETNESIMERHIEKYHLAMDDYATMYESLVLTVQSNKERVAALTSLVPNLVGGGFGLKGAASGIAKATVFNLVRDGAESALIDNSSIKPAQKVELYGRVNQKVLLDRAFLDYWQVYLTLIDILNENGKNVWAPTDADSAKADNIMKNVSNPNFPQDQFPNVMISVIGMDPYKRSIYELLRNRGADENEVKAISEYFGYTDKTPDCIG